MHSKKIGVIADTHSLLRPEAIEFLKGCDLIAHAGDVGNPDILRVLGSIAPTYAIRGNIDKGSWAQELPEKDVLEVDDKFLYLIHSLDELDLDPVAAEFNAVIFGHSHRPESYEKDEVLYFNPGSAGQRRFKLPIQIAKSFGAEVTGVDSTGKLDTISSLGADHVIDFTQEDFTKNGKFYDLILLNELFESGKVKNPGPEDQALISPHRGGACH
jgi:putative phosphoesterase